MTLIVTSEYELQRVTPPNLPLAPGEYDSQYQEQLNNVLRLYFNRLNSIVSQLGTKKPRRLWCRPTARFPAIKTRPPR
jgi:hypothetical protein